MTMQTSATDAAGIVTMKEFERLELKVGEILAVQEVTGSDKLYALQVDIGGKQIQLIAGIRKQYTPKELNGKKIVVVANLAPIKIRGVESQGMLLAAVEPGNDGKITLLTVDRDVQVGSDVA
jgi:methionyl-tRNA synthetase